MVRMRFRGVLTAAVVALATSPVSAARDDVNGRRIGINVVLNAAPAAGVLEELARHGTVLNVFTEIDAVHMRGTERDLEAIRALPFVEAAGPDAERNIPPHVALAAESMAVGISTWDLDAINVTNYVKDVFSGRTLTEATGAGVYVAVLDTGLVQNWPYYFPRERIADDLARSFSGGGAAGVHVSEQPNRWEHDTDSHGTHVTSTILGYAMGGVPINGVAPEATVIPVKVLGQNGRGWSSIITQGILYVADLKAEGGPLEDDPVVINMSLGGPVLDPVEKAAIDYAIANGVIICASAGNKGEAGMGYPGAYPPVISAAAFGWIGEFTSSNWWYAGDVPDPTSASDFYITDFSSRALAGQDLDVAAPGSWVVGPYQTQMGQLSYYFLGGTSQASPHVAGTVALMLEVDPTLTAAEAESVLEGSAIPMPAGCREVLAEGEVCWGTDATGAGLLDSEAAVEAVSP